MNVAISFKTETVVDLDMQARALYMLSSPSTLKLQEMKPILLRETLID
jgi:hypothetical protein